MLCTAAAGPGKAHDPSDNRPAQQQIAPENRAGTQVSAMMSDDRRQKIHSHCANEQNQFKHRLPLAMVRRGEHPCSLSSRWPTLVLDWRFRTYAEARRPPKDLVVAFGVFSLSPVANCLSRILFFPAPANLTANFFIFRLDFRRFCPKSANFDPSSGNRAGISGNFAPNVFQKTRLHTFFRHSRPPEQGITRES